MSPSTPVRYIRVAATRRLTPHMRRVTFHAPSLGELPPPGPDRQVKLFFPRTGRGAPVLPEAPADGDVMRWYAAYTALPEEERPWMRSYTLRAHRPGAREIDVDFVLHRDAGPATRWAAAAGAGDTLGMVGPSELFAVPRPAGEARRLLFACDESGLPALGTLLEALPPTARAVVYTEIEDARDAQEIATEAAVRIHWLPRSPTGAAHGAELLRAVQAARLPDGPPERAWLAGEASTVRALRRHLLRDRGMARSAVEFAGYWRAALSQDDAPTEADLAEARERLAERGEG
ncbi:siderophore-interacting protein [Streptomyces sp. C10-9-1]|uniref:siderophore-interacting protein n=1 Tax=Streptomyces sp. C10-9-1 TaxID=1859285 RepID=UPI003D7434F6